MTDHDDVTTPVTANLRPARPRRPVRGDQPGTAASWDLVPRVQELQEVVWSVADSLAELRDGLAAMSRDVVAIRAAQGSSSKEQATLRDAVSSRLDAILATLEGDASAHQAALDAIAQTPALMRRLDQIARAVESVEGREPGAPAAHPTELAAVTARLSGLEAAIAELLDRPDRDRLTAREIRALRTEMKAAPDKVPSSPKSRSAKGGGSKATPKAAPKAAPAKRAGGVAKRPTKRAARGAG